MWGEGEGASEAVKVNAWRDGGIFQVFSAGSVEEEESE